MVIRERSNDNNNNAKSCSLVWLCLHLISKAATDFNMADRA